MSLSILCITDHIAHNETNSFYRLISGLVRDHRIREVWVATRGSLNNQRFFECSTTMVNALKAGPELAYTETHEFWKGTSIQRDIRDFDGIFLRLPRPVSDDFFLFLERSFPKPEMIINRPSGIVKVSSKEYLLEVASICPPIALVDKLSEIKEMQKEYGELVLKPLREYGGKGIVRIKDDLVTDGGPWEDFTGWYIKKQDKGEFPMLSMKFLPRVTEGDKRIIVVNRQIIGASVRMPSPGSWLCNVAQGGRAELAVPAPEEVKMANTLSSMLMDLGVILFGFDTLVNDNGNRVLSEINALSPGGIWPAELQSGRPLTWQTATALVDYWEVKK